MCSIDKFETVNPLKTKEPMSKGHFVSESTTTRMVEFVVVWRERERKREMGRVRESSLKQKKNRPNACSCLIELDRKIQSFKTESKIKEKKKKEQKRAEKRRKEK